MEILASYFNYGSCKDLFAPGSGIASSYTDASNNRGSGSISVHVIDKSTGSYTVVKTLGSSPDPEQVDQLVRRAHQWISHHAGQSELLILPIELLFHPLENVSLWLAGFLAGDVVMDEWGVSSFNFVSFAIAPVVDLFMWSSSLIPGIWQGIVLIILGVGLILIVVHSIGKILKRLMTGRPLEIMNTAIGRGPISGIGAGTAITVLVQSSSTTTSLIVPMAGSGVMTLKQVYPFTLGGNIGTTVTALLAATAITGATAVLGLQIALLHFLFNVFAILLIFSIPFLRNVPPSIAEKMAEMTQKRKWFVGAYILFVFFLLPLLVLGVSELVF